MSDERLREALEGALARYRAANPHDDRDVAELISAQVGPFAPWPGESDDTQDERADAVVAILEFYEYVASGASRGASGSFYADGKGTLNGIDVPVDMIERLARAHGRTVYGRTSADRRKIHPDH